MQSLFVGNNQEFCVDGEVGNLMGIVEFEQGLAEYVGFVVVVVVVGMVYYPHYLLVTRNGSRY
jgi:hypothetical protein